MTCLYSHVGICHELRPSIMQLLLEPCLNYDTQPWHVWDWRTRCILWYNIHIHDCKKMSLRIKIEPVYDKCNWHSRAATNRKYFWTKTTLAVICSMIPVLFCCDYIQSSPPYLLTMDFHIHSEAETLGSCQSRRRWFIAWNTKEQLW